MIYGYIGCAITLVACFAVPVSLGKTAQYAWFFIAYSLLNGVFYTANNIAYSALAALGQGPWQGDMNAVIASCSEYTFLTQGKRVDGTMYSCTSLGVKRGGGIGTAVVGWLLELRDRTSVV